MSIYCGVFPACDSPTKSQMESLFLDVDPTPEMIVDFKLTNKHDGWSIGASLAKSRKAFVKHYDALPTDIKRKFQSRFLAAGVFYLNEILSNLEATGLNIKDKKELLEKILSDFSSISGFGTIVEL